jgi:hypothetical protein
MDQDFKKQPPQVGSATCTYTPPPEEEPEADEPEEDEEDLE